MGRIIRSILILSLMICLGLTALGLAAEDVSSIAKKILPGTVLIQTYDANGNLLAQGSGFFVRENGDIITCYHVMRGYSSANVTTSDRKEYRVKNVTAINKTNDLIKISLSTTEHDFNSLKLNTTLPEVGQEIVVVGGPLGLESTVSNGIISATRGNATQITAPISPGSSGGPVVNMKGEVIGVVSAQMKLGQNLNFAIPSSLISTMLPASARQIVELLEPMPGALPDDSKPFFNKTQAVSDAANWTRKLGRYGSVLVDIRCLNVQIKPDIFLLEVATNSPPDIFQYFIAPLYATYLKERPEYEGTLILNAYTLKGERKLLMTTSVTSADARMNLGGIAWIMEQNAKYITEKNDDGWGVP